MKYIIVLIFTIGTVSLANTHENDSRTTTEKMIFFTTSICKTFTDDQLGRSCLDTGINWVGFSGMVNKSLNESIKTVSLLACSAHYVPTFAGTASRILTLREFEFSPEQKAACLFKAIEESEKLTQISLDGQSCIKNHSDYAKNHRKENNTLNYRENTELYHKILSYCLIEKLEQLPISK